jgi:MoaA/NifB/PqqE/SkfB family radical SAM enzyme
MSMRNSVIEYLDQRPQLKSLAKSGVLQTSRAYHAVIETFPSLLQPAPRQLTMAITAKCNLGCKGCNYPNNGFMGGVTLPLNLILQALDDAHAAGVSTARFFGGEPLLHPHLPEMIAHAKQLGFDVYVTSNGTLLKSRIDKLYEAGLRFISMGFYGVGEHYNIYTQRSGHYEKLEESLTYVRSQYGSEVKLQLNFVLMRPTCNLDAVRAAWDFARRFDMIFHVDPVSYTLPFFNDGPEDELPFRAGDEALLAPVVAELIRLKRSDPERFWHGEPYLRSLPDWLLHQEEMLMPCLSYTLIWVGADGTVQLCDTTFPLGNLHQTRLKDIFYSQEHKQACRDAFAVKCPNCLCGSESRIVQHRPSFVKYSRAS